MIQIEIFAFRAIDSNITNMNAKTTIIFGIMEKRKVIMKNLAVHIIRNTVNFEKNQRSIRKVRRVKVILTLIKKRIKLKSRQIIMMENNT